MNTFIKDTKTGEIYHFCLYEKWWYYFFLCFVIFLPHQVRRVKNVSEFERVQKLSSNKKENKWWEFPAAIGGGKIIAGLVSAIPIPSSIHEILVNNTVSYFLLVLGLYIFNKYNERTKLGKEIKKILSEDKEIVRFYRLNLGKKKMKYLIFAAFFSIISLMLFFYIEEMTAGLLFIKFIFSLCWMPILFTILALCIIYRNNDKKYTGYFPGKAEW